jgi:hypothetical protein
MFATFPSDVVERCERDIQKKQKKTKKQKKQVLSQAERSAVKYTFFYRLQMLLPFCFRQRLASKRLFQRTPVLQRKTNCHLTRAIVDRRPNSTGSDRSSQGSGASDGGERTDRANTASHALMENFLQASTIAMQQQSSGASGTAAGSGVAQSFGGQLAQPIVNQTDAA